MAGDAHPSPPSAAPVRLRLDRRHFAALAAGAGDPDTVSELLVVERSWRLVQLRAVLDAVRARPEVTGPLSPVAEAWELLVAAQRRDPSEVGTLLLHPQVGTWAGYTLRRLRGSAADPAPLWIDVGYLHALAAAAGVRAGVDFRIEVPLREGFAVLPTLGAARLPGRAGPWDHAEVHHTAGRVTVVAGAGEVAVVHAASAATPAGADAWIPLPAARVRHDRGPTLAVNLDSLDPYRNLRTPAAARPLTAAEVTHWRALLAGAWRLLVETCPQFATPMARGLFSVVPQPPAERFRTMSASAGDAFGSMMVSELHDAVELAVTMVHEFQHIKLGGLLHLTPLHQGEPAQRLYAPWRDDPRPLGGLLQGVYAFIGITEFWRAFRRRAEGPVGDLAQFEFARWRRQVTDTLPTLRGLAQLTDAGRELLAGLAEVTADWRAERVPTGPLAAADAVVADHRARWRLHHLRPDRGAVAALARARVAGDAPPDPPYPEPVVEPDPAAHALDVRAVLTLWRITDPTGFADLRRRPEAVAGRVTGATAADLAAVAGERDRARDGYLAQLAAGPEVPGAWAGLGGTLAAGSPGAAAEALRDRPELVRDVHLAVCQSTGAFADPVALAAWIGGEPSE